MAPPAVRFENQQPVRFRISGEPEWRHGTAVNLSRSGFLFTTFERPPEVGAKLEVYFAPEGDGRARRVATAYVVRRVLHCWPDPCIKVAVRFTEAHPPPFLPEAENQVRRSQ